MPTKRLKLKWQTQSSRQQRLRSCVCLRNRTPTSSPTPQSEGTDGRVSFRDSDAFNNVVKAIAAGNSVLVLGEAGTGKGNFALDLHEELSGEFNSAIATYKGSIKKFYQAIGVSQCAERNRISARYPDDGNPI